MYRGYIYGVYTTHHGIPGYIYRGVHYPPCLPGYIYRGVHYPPCYPGVYTGCTLPTMLPGWYTYGCTIGGIPTYLRVYHRWDTYGQKARNNTPEREYPT